MGGVILHETNDAENFDVNPVWLFDETSLIAIRTPQPILASNHSAWVCLEKVSILHRCPPIKGASSFDVWHNILCENIKGGRTWVKTDSCAVFYFK